MVPAGDLTVPHIPGMNLVLNSSITRTTFYRTNQCFVFTLSWKILCFRSAPLLFHTCRVPSLDIYLCVRMQVYVSVGDIRMCAYMLACVSACEDQKLTLGVFSYCSPTWLLRQTPPWVWCSGFLLGWLIRKPLGSVCFHTSVLELQEHAATLGFHGGTVYRSSVPHAYAKSSYH